jgi:sugar lactone lactonase YvrE
MRRIATALCAVGALVAGFVLPASAGAAFGPVTSFGGSGGGSGQFNHPQGADTSGASVFFADTANGRIETYNSSNGNFGSVTAPGAGFAPQDVTIGGAGAFWTASASRVDHWGLLGIYAGQWTPPGTSYGVAVAPSGVVYVSDAQGGVINAYDGNGTPLGITIGSGVLATPQGLTTDAAGSIYAADPGNGQIVKFGPAGDVQGTWTMPAYTIVANGQTFTGRIEPHDVAVDAAGRVYAPDAGTNSNLLAVFGPDASLLQVIGSPVSDPGNPCTLAGPWGAAVSASSGALYVVSTAENRIRVFDEASAACPAPNLGPGGGIDPTGGRGPGSDTPAKDTKRPKVKLLKVPRKCAHKDFAFKIQATDDVEIAKLLLFINHKRVAKQRPYKQEWTVRVNIPVRKIQRQLPRGTFVRVLILVKVVDSSGKTGKVSKSFRICG